MLYLLESDTRNVKWNGIPLHEATSAIIKEQMNGDFILTVRYPITDSEIYQLFREDMLIKAPAPVIGPQLFRIKKPVENDDHLEITAYHITDDVMQRSINPLSVNKQSCWQALSQLVQVAKSPINDFSFTSDITDRRTINTKEVETLYSVLMDGAHSIVGTWEGELVRDNFSISIKRNRGEDRGVIISTHKNLKSYQRTKNSQNVVTRIHAKSTFKAEGAKEDTTIAITVDSPLIGAYPYINERSYTNNNIQTVEELTKWASAKFTNEHIDKATDAIKIEAYELDGQTVHLGDTVNLKSYKHNVDVYKKAIAYEYDCLANNGQGAYLTITFDDKVKSGGNGGGVSAVANAILDKQETQFDIMLERALANADRAFDTEFAKREKAITDGIELAKSKAEEVKQELSDTINQRFNNFDNGPLKEAKRKAEEALRNAGASSLLAQEAKRIGLDSVAKLEAFKSQTTSAQTALSGDLDALKRTITNDIRPKQAQAEAEIAKQVEALNKTKTELAGVKSSQSTFEQSTTRRLSELTNLANGKASKSELTQTAEELASKLVSVQVGGRNYIRGTRRMALASGLWTSGTFRPSGAGTAKTIDVPNSPATGFDKAIRLTSSNARDQIGIAQDRFEIMPGTYTISVWVKGSVGQRVKLQTYWEPDDATGISSYFILKDDKWTYLTFSSERKKAGTVSIGYVYLVNADAGEYLDVLAPQLENGSLATSPKEAPEDTDGQISAVESNFRQRADSLDASVRSLTEGLRTKADISELNVTAENIRQSVKKLETDTQNKLNQKLSQAEFEVQAGSIRQEILNATKDKADKTLVVAEAGKLREEFSNLRVGGRNYYRDSEKIRTSKRFFSFPLHPYLTQENVGETWTLSFDLKINEGGEIRPLLFYHYQTNRFGLKARANITPSKEWQRFTFTGPVIFSNDDPRYSRGEMALYDYAGNNNYSVRRIKFEKGTLATDWSPAIEDTDGLITEAKATFERTAQGLRTDLSAIQEYVNKDGQRQEALQRYTREESAKQATAVRELVNRDFVGKSTYQEDVRGLERRFEAITNPQNGSIATQIANYKTAVDGRFADISSLLSGKANQSDFQRVKETSQLYERILGNTENGIADKVARMAMTNQLFQVEVAKATKGGRNYIRNGQFKNGSKNWLEFQSVNFGLNFNYQHSLANRNRPGLHFYHDSQDVAYYFGIQQSFAFDGVRGEKVSVSLLVSKDGGANSNLKIGLHYIKNKNIAGQEWQSIPSSQITSKYKRFTFTFTLSDDVENLNLMLYGEKGKIINLYVTDVQFERGSVATDYKEAPEDTEEAIRTVQSQLAGSWSVQNINSAGDIISGINLGATGHNRITGKLTHITGDTLIDNAVIKSAMIDKLKTANFEAGSVTTTILDAEAVTADKVKFDDAFIRKMIANEAFIDKLTSKRIFATKVESVITSSTVLEGYKGWIGGFQLGTHDSGYGRWITGRNHFSVGMGNGEGGDGRTALWVNWGNNWSEPGYYAWFVKNNGKMYCYNTAEFWKTPIINGDLKVTGRIRYDGGVWIYSGEYEKIGRSSKDYFYLEKASGARDWFPAWNDTSDRRLKSNIQESSVSGVDVINRLKTYSYRKEFNNEVEDISCGIMAQDVQKYAPDAFREGPDGVYTYNTFALVPYLIKAIQELNQKIEKMEKTIA
jgi:phage minor structural protein